MELKDFLLLLITAGGSAAAASWVLERMKWYKAIANPENKRWVFFGACVILAGSAFCIITFVPAAILLAIAPYFALVASIFSSVFLGTSFHNVDKLKASGTVENPIITADVLSKTAKAIIASEDGN